tara:strand:- start:302 stop:481 length:180 start_codon:yes stop_codon:yes gene_type:complete
MDIVALGSLLGVIGLLSERIFKNFRKSRCKHILCKCCGSSIDIERVVENCENIESQENK